MFIFAKVYFLLTASYACSTGFESTYEELKPGRNQLCIVGCPAF